jgi:hypothetical protein
MSNLGELLDHEARKHVPSPPSLEDVTRRVHRRQRARRLTATVLGLGLTCTLVAGGLLLLGLPREFGVAPRPQLPFLLPERQIIRQAVAFGSVWTLACHGTCRGGTRNADGMLFRSDLMSGDTLASFAVPTPYRLVLGDDGAWVVSTRDGTVTHVDAGTDTARRIDLGGGPGSDPGGLPKVLVATNRSAWVAVTGGVLIRIDESTDLVTARIDLPREITGLAADRRAVWVAEGTLGIFRIDSTTNGVTDRIPIDGELGRLAVDNVGTGGGSVWAWGSWFRAGNAVGTGHIDYVDTHAPGLAQIDSRTGAVVSSVRVDVHPGPFTYANGRLWTPARGDRALLEVDPKNGRISRVSLPAGTRFIAMGPGVAWIRTGEGAFSSVTLAVP